MTRFEKCNRSWNISWKYISSTTNQIQTIIDNTQTAIRQTYPTLHGEGWVNGFVEELSCYAEIISLPETQIPQIEDSDNQTDRLMKALNAEWQSDRFHLALWLTTLPNPNAREAWILLGKLALLNVNGYPYRIYNPFNLLTINDNIARKLGEGAKIGVSIENAGAGFPETLSSTGVERDIISINGVWTQELVTIQPDADPVIIYIQQGTGSSTQQTATPPAIAVSYTIPAGYTGTDLLITDGIDLTVSCTKLDPTKDAFFQIVKNDVVVTTDTVRSDANGNYTKTVNLRSLLPSPYNGTGQYSFRITQNGLSAETNKLSVVAPTITITPNTFAYNSGTSHYNRYQGYRGNINVSANWLKLVNSVWQQATNPANVYLNYPVDNQVNEADSVFSSAGTYRLQVIYNQVVAYSNNVTVNQQATYDPGLG